MRKGKGRLAAADMRPEYDFTGGVRGKYYKRFQKGANIVLLEPDVSAAFPDSAAVNEALRALALVARRTKTGRPQKAECAEAAEQADADEVREGKAARPSPLIRGVVRTCEGRT